MEGEGKKRERMNMQTFFAPYTVTIADINYGKHLGNDRPLVIFQDARIRFFKSLGLSEGDIGNGRSIVVVESGCRYLRQVFLHEELLVAVTIGELQGKRCRLEYSVQRRGEDQIVFSGFTLLLAYDPFAGKATTLPEQFLAACHPFLREDKSQ
jgi:acyl-CoA thioester hydrolase